MVELETKNVWNSYIACQVRSFEKAKQTDQTKQLLPFITISRQAGAGGITIARKLVKYLKKNDHKALCPWTLFDRNLIFTALKEHNLSLEFAKFMPEGKVSEIKDMVEEMFGLHPSEWALVHKTSETILHLAQAGNVILVGRGANVITRKFLSSGLHVRLIGSLEKRIQHIEEYYHLKKVEAIKFIETADEGRRHYLKENFDKNINDPLLYDLVINTDHVSYDDVAELIGDQVLRYIERR